MYITNYKLSNIYSYYTHPFPAAVLGLFHIIFHHLISLQIRTKHRFNASLCAAVERAEKRFPPPRKMKSKIKHIQLNRVQFFVGKDKRQKVLPTTCSTSHHLPPPSPPPTCWIADIKPFRLLRVAGGSQPPKGEKLYRYNGIAERTIRCVFARRFDCY